MCYVWYNKQRIRFLSWYVSWCFVHTLHCSIACCSPEKWLVYSIWDNIFFSFYYSVRFYFYRTVLTKRIYKISIVRSIIWLRACLHHAKNTHNKYFKRNKNSWLGSVSLHILTNCFCPPKWTLYITHKMEF